MFLISSLEPMSIGVYEDDKGAIDLVKTLSSSSNSMYIDELDHVLRKMASSGDISVQHMKADEQLADNRTQTLDSLESPC